MARHQAPGASSGALGRATSEVPVSAWDYLDPDTMQDSLPQPYRMVCALVQRLVEESIDISERIYYPPPDPKARKDPLALKRLLHVWPSSFKWEEAPTAPVAAICGTGERSPIVFAATTEGELHALDVSRRRTVKKYALPPVLGAGPERILCMAVCNLAPGCNAVALATAAGRVLLLAVYHLFDAEEPFSLLATLQAGTGRTGGSLAFAPDGTHLAVSYEDGALEVYRLAPFPPFAAPASLAALAEAAPAAPVPAPAAAATKPAAGAKGGGPPSKPGTAAAGTRKDAAAAAAAAAPPPPPAAAPVLVLSLRSPATPWPPAAPPAGAAPPPAPAATPSTAGATPTARPASAMATVHFALGEKGAGPGPARAAQRATACALAWWPATPALYRFRLRGRPAVAAGAEWEEAAAAAEATLAMPFRVTASAASRERGLLALGLADGSILLYDALSGREGPALRRLAAPVTALALHSARFLLATAGRRLHMYDLDPAAGPPGASPPPEPPRALPAARASLADTVPSVAGSRSQLGASRSQLAASGTAKRTVARAPSTVSSGPGGPSPPPVDPPGPGPATPGAAPGQEAGPLAGIEGEESTGDFVFAAAVEREAPLGLAVSADGDVTLYDLFTGSCAGRLDGDPSPAPEPDLCATWNPLRPAPPDGGRLFVPRAAVAPVAAAAAAGTVDLQGEYIVLLAEEWIPPPPTPTPDQLAAAAAAEAQAAAAAAAAAAEAQAAAGAKGGKGKGAPKAAAPAGAAAAATASGLSGAPPAVPPRPAALPTRLLVYSQLDIVRQAFPPAPEPAHLQATAAVRVDEVHSSRSRRPGQYPRESVDSSATASRKLAASQREAAGAGEPQKLSAEALRGLGATRRSLAATGPTAEGAGPGRAGAADVAGRVQAALQEREATREARVARAKARGEELLAALERDRAATAAAQSRARAAALAKSPSARA